MARKPVKHHHRVLIAAMFVIILIYLSPLITIEQVQNVADGANEKIGVLKMLVLSLIDLSNAIYALLVAMAAVILYRVAKK